MECARSEGGEPLHVPTPLIASGRATLRVALARQPTALRFHVQFLVGTLGVGGVRRTRNLLDVTIP